MTCLKTQKFCGNGWVGKKIILSGQQKITKSEYRGCGRVWDITSWERDLQNSLAQTYSLELSFASVPFTIPTFT